VCVAAGNTEGNTLCSADRCGGPDALHNYVSGCVFSHLTRGLERNGERASPSHIFQINLELNLDARKLCEKRNVPSPFTQISKMLYFAAIFLSFLMNVLGKPHTMKGEHS